MIFLQKSLDFFILFFVYKMKKDQIYGKNEIGSRNRGLVNCFSEW